MKIYLYKCKYNTFVCCVCGNTLRDSVIIHSIWKFINALKSARAKVLKKTKNVLWTLKYSKDFKLGLLRLVY